MNRDEEFMRIAIKKAYSGIGKGQSPFGACIVKAGMLISLAHNMVLKNTDITLHAEMLAIKKACKRLNRIDLSGCVIYSTCEPCPMCFSACHWARIKKIIYSCGIADAKRYGFNELAISNRRLLSLGASKIKLKPGFLREEGLELFKYWSKRKDKRVY